MGNHYANIVLYNVDRSALIDCLSNLGRTAFISPIVNKFIAIYDRDISADFSEHLFPISRLTELFDCGAIAAYVHDGTEFGYKLYSCGKIIDTYTSACPDLPITIEENRVRRIVKLFECENNWRQIAKILSSPILTNGEFENPDQHYQLDRKYFIDSNYFLSEQDRHESLSLKIGIEPCWSIGIGYNNIIYGDLESHFSDRDLDIDDSIAMLTSINTTFV